MNYPVDWPCECGHPKKVHEIVITNTQKINCTCMLFKPVDNLTYVEMKDNARTA